MSSPTDLLTQTDIRLRLEERGAQIEDYLDYLCAPLLGIVPYTQRCRLRAEAADHLQGLIEDFEAEGFAPPEAVRIALEEYGNPWRIGQDFVTAWLSGAAAPNVTRLTDTATLRAFGGFGIFSVLNLLLIEEYALTPHQEALQPLIACLTVLSPILAGVFTGFALHPKPEGSICRAMIVLTTASLAAGLLLLPLQEGIGFALFQGVFWTPVGCLSAAFTASLRRQHRLQNFPRTTRRS